MTLLNRKKSTQREKSYSLFRRIIFLVVTVYFVAFGLMFLSDVMAVNNSLQIVYESLNASLHMTTAQIQVDLENVEKNVVNRILSQQVNIKTLDRERSQWDGDFYSKLYLVKTDMQNSLPSLELIQGLFVFPTSNQLFISATREGAYGYSVDLRDYTRKILASGELQDAPQRQWFLIQVENTWFLVRYFQLNSIYLGAWINFSDLLALTNRSEDGTVVLYSSNGVFIGDDSQTSEMDLNLPEEDSQKYTLYTDADGEEYVVVCAQLPDTENGSLVLLSPKSPLVGRLFLSYLWMLLCGCVFLVAFIPIMFWILRYLRNPITQLHQSILTLRGGDFDVPALSTTSGCREFNEVNLAFNDMVSHIRSLKIAIYERQLLQQNTEMKFLRSQLAPHFMINCLNAIYHMSAAGENKMVQKMAVSLRSHLRYVLSDHPSVPLKQELNMVENYLKLFSIRYPKGIIWEFSVLKEIEEVAVLPMMILPFIENSVKYEIVPGECLHIHVSAGLSPEKKEVYIVIWDSGSGWTQELLETLNSGNLLNNQSGKHIGIAVHGSRGIIESRQQVGLDIPNLGRVIIQAIEHILHMGEVHFQETAFYHLTGVVIPGNADIWPLG